MRKRLPVRSAVVVLSLLAALFVRGQEPDADFVQIVINLLGDKDKDIRAVGLEQVRTQAKGQEATRQFAAQLPKLAPDAQVGLLRALAERGDAAARPAVVDLLAKSNVEPVRIAAIEALGLLGESADLPLLVRLLASGAAGEQAAARTSLVDLRGEDVSPALAAELRRSPPMTRAALLDILAARRATDAVPAMLAAALDADATVRGAALAALGQLAGPQHVPELVQIVLKSAKGAPRDAAEKTIMLACSRIADTENRAAPLLAAMATLNDADHTALLPALGRVGTAAALATVEAAIAAGDPARHAAGVRALCNWPEASVAPRLIELANTTNDVSERALLVAALIRVAPLPDKRPPAQKLELLATAMKMCTGDDQRNLVLKRASAIRTIETLRFVLPYLEQPAFAQQACQTIVELAHHRSLREPNKKEFDQALDKVIQTSEDATVVERANRYKRGQTWVRASGFRPSMPRRGQTARSASAVN